MLLLWEIIQFQIKKKINYLKANIIITANYPFQYNNDYITIKCNNKPSQ